MGHHALSKEPLMFKNMHCTYLVGESSSLPIYHHFRGANEHANHQRVLVIAAYGHSEPQRSHQSVTDLLSRKMISEGEGNGPMTMEGKMG
ncbi:hypothetical protein EVAR_20227_1 [Eumeta japonica]|uniref:Uncharacterized protein n=1 Tax=Eumeta variegata TaxID=151549 RepID=A0A4C1W881_EUMVA|nr:hypothetical protein EVAR_20227_1 [Eumeta japonica]